MLKSCFNNTEPKLLNYRDFKHFSQEAFKEDLSEALCDCGNSYDDFEQRHYVVNLNKESKLEYFSKYESNGNKTFWVNCKPYFTNEHSKADTVLCLVKMET